MSVEKAARYALRGSRNGNLKLLGYDITSRSISNQPFGVLALHRRRPAQSEGAVVLLLAMHEVLTGCCHVWMPVVDAFRGRCVGIHRCTWLRSTDGDWIPHIW